MENQKKKDIVLEYLKTNYGNKSPIFVNKIYEAFPQISKETIRSVIRRSSKSGVLKKVNHGVYALPNKDSVLREPTVFVSDIMINKYIMNQSGERVGYFSGINFANQVGLTSQTASIPTIYSNNVSNKKRIAKLGNTRIIVNAPRVEVTDKNYRLLQVLDLLNEFDKYSEYDLKSSSDKIFLFLKDIDLEEDEVETIVSKYPLRAQVKFYKIGGNYAITRRL